MNGRRRFFDEMSISAELPMETLPGVPLVEIAGQNRVLIENHTGVVKYTCDEICVKVKFGYLCVSGKGLTLARMSRQQLVITGMIHCVSLQ